MADATLSRTAKPSKTPAKRKLRAVERRLLAVVRDLDDAQVDDVTRALKSLLAVGKYSSK